MTDDPTDIARADAMTSVNAADHQALYNHQVLYNHHARILAMDERITCLTRAVTALGEANMLYDAGRHGGMNFGTSKLRNALDDALQGARLELSRLIVDRSMMGKG